MFCQMRRLLCVCSCKRKYDIIGPPDSLSNIRPVKLKSPTSPDDELIQRLQHEVWELNHEFWSKHNKQFKEEKAEFISRVRPDGVLIGKVSVNELSSFYKEFLDSKYADHMQYSKQWMKVQFKLTWNAFKIKLKTRLSIR